jgi:hypothetical protein
MNAARHGHGREAGMIMAKQPPIHASAGLERLKLIAETTTSLRDAITSTATADCQPMASRCS